jgi:hypothetical protein
MNDPILRERAKIRTAGLRRLKRVTRIAALSTAALAALFSAVAARSTPGHKSVRPAHVAVHSSTIHSSTPPPPALPSEQGSASASPLAPSQAPAPTQQPPVVVSGGS